jgi:hypothetical protein
MTNQPTALPGGFLLTPGEAILINEKFMLSSMVFYLHTNLSLTDRRLYVARTHVSLGLPVGASNDSFPIDQIAGVSTVMDLNIPLILLAVVFILFIGLPALFVSIILGLIALFVSLLVINIAVRQGIQITNTGGGNVHFPVSFFERGRTIEFANHVSAVLAQMTAYNRPQNFAADGAPPSQPNVTESMINLYRLHEQSLISDAEFTAKRTEVLGRL